MLTTNHAIIKKLRSKITTSRLDRIMMAVEDASTVVAVIAITAAVYFLILMPIHRMILP